MANTGLVLRFSMTGDFLMAISLGIFLAFSIALSTRDGLYFLDIKSSFNSLSLMSLDSDSEHILVIL